MTPDARPLDLIPVEELAIEVRPYNCLKNGHINTLGQLLKWSRPALLRLQNMGPKSVDNIERELEWRGLKLADDEGNNDQASVG